MSPSIFSENPVTWRDGPLRGCISVTSIVYFLLSRFSWTWAAILALSSGVSLRAEHPQSSNAAAARTVSKLFLMVIML